MTVVAAISCLEQGFLPPTKFLLENEQTKILNLSSKARPSQAKNILIIAMEQNKKAAALIISREEKIEI